MTSTGWKVTLAIAAVAIAGVGIAVLASDSATEPERHPPQGVDPEPANSHAAPTKLDGAKKNSGQPEATAGGKDRGALWRSLPRRNAVLLALGTMPKRPELREIYRDIRLNPSDTRLSEAQQKEVERLAQPMLQAIQEADRMAKTARKQAREIDRKVEAVTLTANEKAKAEQFATARYQDRLAKLGYPEDLMPPGERKADFVRDALAQTKRAKLAESLAPGAVFPPREQELPALRDQ